ncbi:IclR family transcriptional regulator [Ruania rhizosphaerae]|uniref:IclR family transcriptional regulator n=1 Tax=Ruania rhizosphaerae TaxID=1840413 RepID=UPI001F3E86F2|nr:IclR family transcriptional regulator [Ruania rhizosphaerae]
MSTTSAARAEPEETAGRRVKSAERTLHLLDALAAAGAPLPMAELHRRVGYPRSSLHQLIHTMAASGWVELTEAGEVRIGAHALVVGTSYLDREPALPLAQATLERVRDSTGYTTHYARRDDAHILYLATRETTNSSRATSRVGRRLPAHATSLGKALLAELSAAELDEALGEEPLAQLTPQTIVERDLLTQSLEKVRRTGYAVEREENTPGVCCVATTISYRIPATDAISCSIPSDRATTEELENVGSKLASAAHDLATQLRSAGVR